MTKQTLERANELNRILKAIDDAKNIVRKPYPSFYHDCYNNSEEVSFVKFDKVTINELKDAINDVLNRREEVLKKELEEL